MYSLRSATDHDFDRLFALHKVALGPYVERTWGWDEEFQLRMFRESFDPAAVDVVSVDGEFAGCLSVEYHDDHVFLDYVALLPAFQAQGVGSALVRDVQERARLRGLPVRLNVLKVNPARELYERLGFHVIGEDDVRWSMEWASGSDSSLRFLEFAQANPINAALLDRLPALSLPDCWLVAGCLSQSVWNGLTDQSPTHGIDDYDVFYFEESDLSRDAEDRIIARCDDAFADLDAKVQVRNQARVHLWYPEKYGLPYPPLVSSRDGIDSFLNQSSCFGVRSGPDGDLDVYAPFGYSDLFELVVRPNPRHFLPRVYYEKAARWRRLWPALTVVPWDGVSESQ